MSSKIHFKNNGPLVLEADLDEVKQMTGRYGDRALEKANYLCRCGASANKPYCDGTHKRIGFCGDRDISAETIQTYTGKSLTVIFNRSICCGAAKCVESLPDVFRSGDSESWIFPDKGDVGAIIRVIEQCPSGALSYQAAASEPVEVERGCTMHVVENGPYLLVGEFELDAEIPEATRNANRRLALCRCGLSRNKPYCDYSHAEQGWKDDESK